MIRSALSVAYFLFLDKTIVTGAPQETNCAENNGAIVDPGICCALGGPLTCLQR